MVPIVPPGKYEVPLSVYAAGTFAGKPEPVKQMLVPAFAVVGATDADGWYSEGVGMGVGGSGTGVGDAGTAVGGKGTAVDVGGGGAGGVVGTAVGTAVGCRAGGLLLLELVSLDALVATGPGDAWGLGAGMDALGGGVP